MRALFVLAVALLAASAALAQPSELAYQKGQEFVFVMGSSVDARHADGNTLQPGAGSFATMNSTVVYKCVDIAADGSYLFVMNMFGTVVGVGQNALNGAEKAKADAYRGSIPVVGDNDALGYDMYFQQKRTGEIVQIWYDKADSPYFVNVKVGAISAFQTRLLPVNQKAAYQESDPVGVHMSNFVGVSAPNNGLGVVKTFTQKDFSSFATDPSLTNNDILLSAGQHAIVHPSGFIQSTSVQQDVLLVNTQKATFTKTKLLGASNDGFNMFMRSRGDMNIVLKSFGMVQGPQKTLESRFAAKADLTFSALTGSEDLVRDTFTGYASKAAKMAKLTPADINIDATLAEILSSSDESRVFSLMAKAIKYLRIQEGDMTAVESLLEDIKIMSDIRKRDRLFYILASLDACDLLVTYGISSVDRDVRMHAILTASAVKSPSSSLAGSLFVIATTDKDQNIRNAALLAYGALLKGLSPLDAKLASNALRKMLREVPLTDSATITSILAAVSNAGPSVIPFHEVSEMLSFLSNGARLYTNVNAAVERVLRAYKAHPLAQQMVSGLSTQMKLEASDFPFNKSFTKELIVGGNQFNLGLKGELFAGTNFDCNQPYFNYEGLARVTASLTLFTETKPAVVAEAIYGRENGAPLANHLSLWLLGKTIYDYPLPTLDCREHTYNLYHSEPAISASYVVWISVIPVVFSASAGLTLNADWGWNICDADLSAMIEVIPGAGLKVQGDVELDLLIIRAGIELAGTVNTQLHPQGYIHGSQCEVGFDVLRTNQPMDAYFESFYQTKKCKFWIFDCHWNANNEQKWWQWDGPASSETLYNQAWKIKV